MLAARFFNQLLICALAVAILGNRATAQSAADPSSTTQGTSADAQQASDNKQYPPKIEGAQVEVYKSIGDVKLNAYIFHPKTSAGANRSPRPAIIFFFGGGWRSGSPTQFENHCRYLAERGMVAITADYRVASRHEVKAVSCVADAKSAIRWVRENAQRLGVDPTRIVAAGGSAGGHLAACTGVIRAFDEEREDTSISSVPNALALFNPALVLAPVGDDQSILPEKLEELRDRMGVEPSQLSPLHMLSGKAPPTIIFHGKEDTTVPYQTAELFAQAMKDAGNRCELIGYDDQKHGFFNYGRGDGTHYQDTLNQLDAFLVSLGYLPATDN